MQIRKKYEITARERIFLLPHTNLVCIPMAKMSAIAANVSIFIIIVRNSKVYNHRKIKSFYTIFLLQTNILTLKFAVKCADLRFIAYIWMLASCAT